MTRSTKFCGYPAVRVAALALCAAAISVSPVLAQDSAPPPPQQQGPGGGGPRGARMQEHMLEDMTQKLGLTPDQVTKIKAIQADNREKMRALRDDSSTTPDDRRAKSMAMRRDEQEKMKALLTEDQKTKYQAMMEQMRQNRRGGDQGGPPPEPPPATAPQDL
jgi:protein CpxP